jgi:hypothetical protein
MSSFVADSFPSHAIFNLLIVFQSYHQNYLFRRFGEYPIAATVGFCFSSFPDFDARFSILKRKKGGFAGDVSTLVGANPTRVLNNTRAGPCTYTHVQSMGS